MLHKRGNLLLEGLLLTFKFSSNCWWFMSFTVNLAFEACLLLQCSYWESYLYELCSQVDPIVASFSGGAVGVISALMVVEINNVKQQEHKRCKYCLGTGSKINR